MSVFVSLGISATTASVIGVSVELSVTIAGAFLVNVLVEMNGWA